MSDKKSINCSAAKLCGRNFTLISSIDSTNNYVKKLSAILPDGHVVISDEQLGGRGRQGKTFYSPNGEGLYMSVLFKNEKNVTDELFTAKISIAVCRAIDRITGTDNNSGVGIKWVNDVYFGKKKLCGILCERFKSDDGSTNVVAGIGINVKLTGNAIPKEIRSTVTSLYDITKTEYDRMDLALLVCDELSNVFALETSEALSEYKKRSIVIGREIRIVHEDGDIRAAALDICEDGALLVRTEEGYTRKLCGGEISIKIKR